MERPEPENKGGELLTHWNTQHDHNTHLNTTTNHTKPTWHMLTQPLQTQSLSNTIEHTNTHTKTNVININTNVTHNNATFHTQDQLNTQITQSLTLTGIGCIYRTTESLTEKIFFSCSSSSGPPGNAGAPCSISMRMHPAPLMEAR